MQRVAILGCGTMGEAILAGLIRSGCPESLITATVRRPERLEELRRRFGGVTFGTDNLEAARDAGVVVLAVKPQSAKSVVRDVELVGILGGKLVVSICAGVTLDQLARWIPGARVIRAMPNTPSVIGEGMTVLAGGLGATVADFDTASSIFEAVGRVRVLDEKHLDAVTGLSGSGPAFVCIVLEALADGGVMMGLPREVAVELAAQTMQGAARLVLETGAHPASLKDDVTTPAGCTIAGILTMEDGRIRSTLARTIQEATRVASGLGDE